MKTANSRTQTCKKFCGGGVNSSSCGSRQPAAGQPQALLRIDRRVPVRLAPNCVRPHFERVEALDRDDYVAAIDREQPSVFVVIHIFEHVTSKHAQPCPWHSPGRGQTHALTR